MARGKHAASAAHRRAIAESAVVRDLRQELAAERAARREAVQAAVRVQVAAATEAFELRLTTELAEAQRRSDEMRDALVDLFKRASRRLRDQGQDLLLSKRDWERAIPLMGGGTYGGWLEEMGYAEVDTNRAARRMPGKRVASVLTSLGVPDHPDGG